MKMRKRLVALLLVVAMVLSMAAPALAATPTDTGSLPTDVKADIQRLIDAGIVSGYPDGTFKPDGTLTRGDFAKYVVNAAGLAEEKPATPSFKDVGASMANYGFIEAAAKAKIIQGFVDGTYGPTVAITKGQAAVIALRIMGKSPGGSYANEVKAAVTEGLLESAAVSAQTATRAQAAVVIVDTGLVPATPKAASITITSSATTDNIAKGSSIKLTAAVKDASGNAVAGAQVTWSADKGVIASDGTYAATEAGAITITAKSGDISATKQINVYGIATKIQLSAPAKLVANNASKGTITATAVDANGNVVPTFEGTINFTPSAGALSATSSKAVKGVASVDLTAPAAGTSLTVSAAATGLTGAIATVSLEAQKLTSVKLTADPATIAADNGSTSTVTVAALDQEGKAISTSVSVKLTSSNTSAAKFAAGAEETVTLTNQTSKTAVLTATNNIGATTITGVVTTASLTSVPVTSVTITSAVVGVAYKLNIGSAITDAAADNAKTHTVKVDVLDANGNRLTGDNATVVALAASPNTGLTITPVAGGVAAKGQATFTVTSTKAQEVTYTATSGTLVKATATGKFVANAASLVTLTATPGVISANGVSTSVLKAEITDANGNKVTSGSYAVEFTKTADAGATAAFAKTTVNSENGVATVTVTSTSKATSPAFDTYQARVAFTVPSTATANVATAIFGAANKIGGVAVSAAGPTAGDDITVSAQIQDSASTVLTNDNDRTVTVTVKKAGTTEVVGTFTGTTANGVASVKVNMTKSGAYDVDVTADGLTKATSAGLFTYAASTATTLTIKSDLSTLGADNSSIALLTLGLVDKYNNVVTAGGQTVNLALSAQGNGTLSAAAPVLGVGTGTATVNFTVSSTPGSVTISASSTGLTSASTTISTILVGAAAKLSIDTISETVADNTKTQTIKVNVLDANGNRVTSDNVTAITLAASPSAGLTISDSDADPLNGFQAVAVKGQATFTVKSTKAQEVTYTASSGALVNASAKGTFVPGAAAQVTVAVAPNSIKGDGSSIASVTVRIEDAQGNLVPTVNGTVTLEVVDVFAAYLIGAADNGKLTVQITNGVGSAIAQAKDLSLAVGPSSANFQATYVKDSSTTWTSAKATLTVTQ